MWLLQQEHFYSILKKKKVWKGNGKRVSRLDSLELHKGISIQKHLIYIPFSKIMYNS